MTSSGVHLARGMVAAIWSNVIAALEKCFATK
jgi:hypothetical protein